MGRRRFTEHGKPMKALRALAVLDGQRAGEQEVWRTIEPGGRPVFYHDALRQLVEAGFAERHGSRGGYHWKITEAGRYRIAGGETPTDESAQQGGTDA